MPGGEGGLACFQAFCFEQRSNGTLILLVGGDEEEEVVESSQPRSESPPRHHFEESPSHHRIAGPSSSSQYGYDHGQSGYGYPQPGGFPNPYNWHDWQGMTIEDSNKLREQQRGNKTP